MTKNSTAPTGYTEESAINLDRIAVAMLKKFWLILMVGTVFGSMFLFYAKAVYTEMYVSSATLAFTTTSYVAIVDDNGDELAVKEQKKHYSDKDVERYQFLLKSDVMVGRVYDALDGQYKKTDIEKSFSVSGTAIPGIFVVRVTNNDREFCRNAIKEVIETFPEYLQSFDTSLGIDVIKKPQEPVVSNEDNAASRAFYGFVTGAALVIVIVFITEASRDTIRQTEDIKNKTSLRILGAVPAVEKKKRAFSKKKPGESLLMTEDNKLAFAFVESFKSIRTKIENIAAEKGYKLFVVTSPFENEGKTTVAINIACALAQKGKSVLLVDCDLRNPSVLNMAGIKDDGKVGLLPIIKNSASYTDSIKFVKPLGIFVLSSGGTSPRSTEVLDADKVRDVLKKAAEEFDYILIDTPPVHVVADCLVIAPLADALIFTVRRDYARVSDINETLEELAATDVDVLGCVMTMSSPESSRRCLSRGRLYHYYRHRKGSYKSYRSYGYESKEENE